MDTTFSFSRIGKAHLIGVKGAGMAALAEILVSRGVRVTGSDTEEVFFTDAVLRRLGILFTEGFSVENIPSDAEVVVYSTAYTSEKNPELASAMRKGCPVLSYPEAVGSLTREHLTLAVSGTHGKTTTSALLAHALSVAGEDPLALVGSRIREWGGNALVGSGKYFVLEADEYQDKLSQYAPFSAIVTSVDWDHPDYFPTAEAYGEVFARFVGRIPPHGYAVLCGDSASVLHLSGSIRGTVLTYGFLSDNTYRITDWQAIVSEETDADGVRQSFDIVTADGGSLGTYRLRLAGRHNAQNAAAVVALSEALRIDREAVRGALESFSGTERRFEHKGVRDGVAVYDDYAHHPEEVRATLRSFRELYPGRRLLVAFHPHTFTRTRALLQEFAQSFDDADRVFLLDIYGSAREEQGGVSSDDVAELINTYHPGRAENVHDTDGAAEAFRAEGAQGDIVVTMGAGNVWEAGEKFLKS